MVRPLILAMAAAVWLAAWNASPAWAQQPDGAAGAQPVSPSYSEAELKSVALAAVEVQRISDVYLPRLYAAASSEEQQEVRQAATTEMKQAIARHISVGRYTEIVTLARLDGDLAARIRRHIPDAHAP